MTFTEEQKTWARNRENGSRTRFFRLFIYLYGFRHIRKIVLRLCLKLEGGVFFSRTLKVILERYHGVSVGRYSYGPCNIPGDLPRGTVVGSYCSFANELIVRRRNHPVETLTQHPFFFNRRLGLISKDTIIGDEENPLTIGHDVWIGDRVTVLPGCTSIGNGAIVGAGSIVTRNVAPYSIVVGSPARAIGERYPHETQAVLEASKWWTLALPELLEAEDLLFEEVEPASVKAVFGQSRKQGLSPDGANNDGQVG